MYGNVLPVLGSDVTYVDTQPGGTITVPTTTATGEQSGAPEAGA